MIDLDRISRSHLENEPYQWASIDTIFSPADASALARTFPEDHFKRLADYDGEKPFEYEVRSLIRMGERSASRARLLSPAWRALVNDFLSPAYRAAMSSLTGLDLRTTPLEVNLFHYPPGGLHGAHPDHRNKIVTQLMYFNETWNDEDGGCLTVLRSSDTHDIAGTVSPLVGNSAVLIRSDNSWHAVSPVATHCHTSRRSLTATFYRQGCVSTVWPSWSQRLMGRWQRSLATLSGTSARG